MPRGCWEIKNNKSGAGVNSQKRPSDNLCDRLQKSRFRKFSEGGKRRKWSSSVSHHSPSPFLHSLQTFRSIMVRRSRSQKIRLFCSLSLRQLDCSVMRTKACRPTTLSFVLEICEAESTKASQTAGFQISCGCKIIFDDLKLKINNWIRLMKKRTPNLTSLWLEKATCLHSVINRFILQISKWALRKS